MVYKLCDNKAERYSKNKIQQIYQFFSARWLSIRGNSFLKTSRWTFLWEETSRVMAFLVNFLAKFPLRISCQYINFYPLYSRCGNHFGVCSVNVEMIVRTSLTAETPRSDSTYILHSHSALTETKRKSFLRWIIVHVQWNDLSVDSFKGKSFLSWLSQRRNHFYEQ